MNEQIARATELINAGELVAFPTETVYGLGADATNEVACRKIFAIKGRPSINPLIIHVPTIELAKDIAIFNDKAEKLAVLWPGPMTLVLPLKKDNNIAPSVLAGLDTIAIRIPSHPITMELLQNLSVPVAAPSANISGYISSTTYEHVLNDFGQNIFMLQDYSNNKRKYGIESTIVDLTTNTPTILRSGVITAEDIEMILLEKILYGKNFTTIKAPGMLNKHYSPSTQVILNVKLSTNNAIGINFADSNLLTDLNLSPTGDLLEVAINLYQMLRLADGIALRNNFSRIEIAPIPNYGIGVAINDRLKRASFK